MNITEMAGEVLDVVTLRHRYKDDSVPQIANYIGKINLRGLAGDDITLGVFFAEEVYCHFLFLRNSIEEIKKDYEESKKIKPFVVFTVKVSEEDRFVRLSSGYLERIELSALSYDEITIFLELQKVLYQKIK